MSPEARRIRLNWQMARALDIRPLPGRHPALPLSALALFALLAFAGPAMAGSLCGTIRDAATSAPVAHAGVFLREPSGAYTGLHAATNASGSFCIDFVPPGVYDIEVLVDDYRVAYLRGITVTGAVTDVPVEVSAPGLFLVRPSPSPASSQVTFAWYMPAAEAARLAVFDARGRLVGDWAGGLSSGMKSVSWDLHDLRGLRVPAGVYYVRLLSGAAQRVRRFVVLP
jgi:hypothetical protein